MPDAQPFVGRQDEIAQIREAVEAAGAGTTQFVMIEGFAGFGKTSLVRRALEPYRDWARLSLTLDEKHREEPGAAIRQLLGRFAPEVEDPDELARGGLQGAQDLGNPVIVTISDLQAIDDRSAELLHSMLTSLDESPLVLIALGRPTLRREVLRLRRLAEGSPQGTFIRLEPLSTDEVRRMLSAATDLPVSSEAARRVAQETDGIPRSTAPVAQWLRQHRPGTRSVERALTETVRRMDHRPTREAVDCLVEDTSPTVLPALKALAVSEEPLSKPQLDQIIGEPVDVQSLTGTGLVEWGSVCSGFSLHYETLSEALQQDMDHQELVSMQQNLAEVLDGVPALVHRAEAVRQAAEAMEADVRSVRDDLMSQAAQLRASGELEGAFPLVDMACQLRPTEDTLVELADLALRTGRTHELPKFQPAVGRLKHSCTRAALLAFVELEHNDPQAALQELEHCAETSADRQRVLLHAEAVSRVSGLFVIRGLNHRGAELRARTLASLGSARTGLEAELEQTQPDAAQPDADAARQLRATIGEIVGTQALISLWDELSLAPPVGDESVIERITGLIEEAEQWPGTEQARRGLTALRGTRYRQLGRLDAAYQDLTTVAAMPVADLYVQHAQTQLVMLLFSAGLWQEAETIARRAAGSALTLNENSASLQAYAARTMLPAGRAEENAETLAAQLEKIRWQDGPMLTAMLEWSTALRAAAQGDYERIAQAVMNMRDSDAGLWTAAIDLIMVLGRSLFYGGRSERLPSLVRSLHHDPVMQTRQGPVVRAYVEALERWSARSPQEAMAHLETALEGLDAEPPLRPTQPAGEGGGLRLARAMLTVDYAALVLDFPEEFESRRANALDLAAWGSSVYQSCGVDTQVEFASTLISRLRPTPAVPSVGPSVGPSAVQSSGVQSTASAPGAVSAGAEQGGVGQSAGDGADSRGDGSTAGAGVVGSAASSGVEALERLSRREQEVALLVRRQLTNREIAEELVLSVRTVEYHVANILTKLDVKSRRQLRELLPEPPQS